MFRSDDSRSAGSRARVGAAPFLLAAALYLWLFAHLIDLSYGKAFSMDELGFLHAGWMTARGYTVFEDFVLLFIGVGQVSAIPAFFAADNVDALLAMRLFQLLFVGLLAAAAWRTTRTDGPLGGAIAAALMFAMWPFTQYMVEVRPDSIAFPLFIASVAVLYESRLRPAARGAACGALYAAASWMTPKAFICGGVFFAAIAVDALRHRKNLHAYVVHPAGFAAGGGLLTAALASVLAMEGTLGGLWSVSLPHALDHERLYPSADWLPRLARFFSDQPWVPALALVGTWDIVRRRPGGRPEQTPADWVLLGAAPTTFLSYVLQKGALSYSWLPFVGVVCVLAAKGAFVMARALERRDWARWAVRRSAAAALLVLVGGAAAIKAAAAVKMLERQRPNDHQLSVISTVCDLTWPTDRWYDSSASYVVRPNAARFYFTDKVMRRTLYNEMLWDVSKELLGNGCKGWIHDRRYEELPWALQGFLNENFVAYDDDIRLWGRRFDPFDAVGTERRFIAIEDGWYFVHPAAAAAASDIRIDGRPVGTANFRLARGRHTVTFPRAKEPFYVLWLPRNGRRYVPEENPRPRFYRYTNPV